MKTILASTAASALLLSLAALAAQTAPSAPLIEGKGRPILLKRMVVTATPL